MTLRCSICRDFVASLLGLCDITSKEFISGEYFFFAGEVFFLNSTDREVDLAALVYCNHTIMSTGTFSWWAAYLADGDAVYYGDWPKPGSVLQKIVQKEDFFLEKWTAMR